MGFIHTKTALQKATLRNGNPSYDLGENIRQVPSDKGLVSKIDKEPSQLDSTKKNKHLSTQDTEQNKHSKDVPAASQGKQKSALFLISVSFAWHNEML